MKREIKINKSSIFLVGNDFFKSIVIALLIMFIITLFGEIRPSGDMMRKRVEMKYYGVLTDKYGYDGNGRIYQLRNLTTYKTTAAGIPLQESNSRGQYLVQENLFLGTFDTDRLKLRDKLLCYYIPLILFNSFLIWIVGTIFIFCIFQLIRYLRTKISITIE